ncbi:putative RING-H2 finger protein ATL49 [Cornus florida]|uniref:putative RING-H2 finger protein ATL49 n=1 Tax=Cornus florida TaxID=4283 RepID=UPI00289BA45A|nr:putative RING-H2 finger protein ATL49 [Cornus florida]
MGNLPSLAIRNVVIKTWPSVHGSSDDDPMELDEVESNIHDDLPLIRFLRAALARATNGSMDRAIQESVDDYVGLKLVPATQSSIDALEKITFYRSCAICLEEFSDEQSLTRMPCSHLFHGDCITRWLHTSHSCPLCRFKMPTTSSFHPEKKTELFKGLIFSPEKSEKRSSADLRVDTEAMSPWHRSNRSSANDDAGKKALSLIEQRVKGIVGRLVASGSMEDRKGQRKTGTFWNLAKSLVFLGAYWYVHEQYEKHTVHEDYVKTVKV